jgi:hypothetical protein
MAFDRNPKPVQFAVENVWLDERLAPPQLSRLRARLAILNGTGDRRFWLSARALVLRTAGRWQRPLAIRDMRRISTGERRSHILMPGGRLSFP